MHLKATLAGVFLLLYVVAAARHTARCSLDRIGSRAPVQNGGSLIRLKRRSGGGEKGRGEEKGKDEEPTERGRSPSPVPQHSEEDRSRLKRLMIAAAALGDHNAIQQAGMLLQDAHAGNPDHLIHRFTRHRNIDEVLRGSRGREINAYISDALLNRGSKDLFNPLNFEHAAYEALEHFARKERAPGDVHIFGPEIFHSVFERPLQLELRKHQLERVSSFQSERPGSSRAHEQFMDPAEGVPMKRIRKEEEQESLRQHAKGEKKDEEGRSPKGPSEKKPKTDDSPDRPPRKKPEGGSFT